MNGVGVKLDAPPDVTEAPTAALVAFLADKRPRQWCEAEYRRLAAAFDPESDVPLTEWQAVHRPSLEASIDAVERLLQTDLGDLETKR